MLANYFNRNISMLQVVKICAGSIVTGDAIQMPPEEMPAKRFFTPMQHKCRATNRGGQGGGEIMSILQNYRLTWEKHAGVNSILPEKSVM